MDRYKPSHPRGSLLRRIGIAVFLIAFGLTERWYLASLIQEEQRVASELSIRLGAYHGSSGYLDSLRGTPLFPLTTQVIGDGGRRTQWGELLQSSGLLVFLFRPLDCSACLQQAYVLNRLASTPGRKYSWGVVGVCISRNESECLERVQSVGMRFPVYQVRRGSLYDEAYFLTPYVMVVDSCGRIGRARRVEPGGMGLEEFETWIGRGDQP